MMKRFSMKRIIRTTVLIFFFKTATDFDSVFGRNRDITAVKEAVKIAAEKEAIVHSMRTALNKRLDMGCFESRKRMLFGYRASPVIGVRDENAERSLPETRTDHRFFPVSAPFFIDAMGFLIQAKHLLAIPGALEVPPDELAGLFVEFIAFRLTADDRCAPIRRWKPHRFIKEEGLGQDDAADMEILVGIVGYLSILEKLPAHFRERASSVSFFESLPGQAYREN